MNQQINPPTRPPIHVIPYGDFGTGKSSFAATFPKPMLVFLFDAIGKDIPYQTSAHSVASNITALTAMTIGTVNVPYYDITHPDGVIRVEYYHDHDPDAPIAYNTFRSRMAAFQHEYGKWKTVVVDSVTSMELLARLIEVKLNNPAPPNRYLAGSKFDSRQWFAGSTDALEQMLCVRFAGFPLNVVVVCHIDERRNEVSGEILRGIFAPGRLSKRNLINTAYQEQYRTYTVRGEDGKLAYGLQTQHRDGFAATTLISAPDPCYPHYESLWAGYRQPGTGGGDAS